MCVKYYAVSIEKSSTNKETKIVVKDEITKEEFENLFSVATFLKEFVFGGHFFERHYASNRSS